MVRFAVEGEAGAILSERTRQSRREAYAAISLSSPCWTDAPSAENSQAKPAQLSRIVIAKTAEPRALAEKAETWREGSPSLRDWRASMASYVLPQLGPMHVGAVATADVKRVLRPLALAGKHATARMVAGRIAAVLEWAEVENLREPAGSGRAAVETVMRSLPKAAAVRHHRALHFSDVAAALARVGGHPRVGRVVQLAIRFGVLTAARQAEVRRATWEEFDMDDAVWTVPAAHMKRGRAHRVPLSTGALAVLDEARDCRAAAGWRSRARAAWSSASRRCRRRWPERRWARRRTASVRASRTGRATGGGRTAVGVRPGACRGLEDGGRLRARRPAGEASPGDAGVVRLRRPARSLGGTDLTLTSAAVGCLLVAGSGVCYGPAPSETVQRW